MMDPYIRLVAQYIFIKMLNKLHDRRGAPTSERSPAQPFSVADVYPHVRWGRVLWCRMDTSRRFTVWIG